MSQKVKTKIWIKTLSVKITVHNPLTLSTEKKWCHITKMSPLLTSKSQIGSHKDRSIKTHTHTETCAIRSSPSCFNLWQRRLLQTLVPIPRPRLVGRLPLVSHHPSAGAEVEDDTQLGHSMTRRLCFLSNTPLRSLSNSSTFLCIIPLLLVFFFCSSLSHLTLCLHVLFS